MSLIAWLDILQSPQDGAPLAARLAAGTCSASSCRPRSTPRGLNVSGLAGRRG